MLAIQISQHRKGSRRTGRRSKLRSTSAATKTMVLGISSMGQRDSDTTYSPAKQRAHSTSTSPCKLGASASATTHTAHQQTGTRRGLMGNVAQTAMVVAGGMRCTLAIQV